MNLKYKEGDSIADHLNKVKNIINQLAFMKVSLNDELQALLLLSSLAARRKTLVVLLNNSVPDGKVSVSMVISSFSQRGG